MDSHIYNVGREYKREVIYTTVRSYTEPILYTTYTTLHRGME